MNNGKPKTRPRIAGSAQREPLAIIGIGCRLPGGANSPELFWNLLENGVDAIREIPEDRWSADAFYDTERGKPGKTLAHWGGVIDDIDQFDPQFFGISPREAANMDPQQRIVLETAWEAFEDGGQVLERIGGSNTAVFVGISTFDYAHQGMSWVDRGVITPYSNTGASMSIAANRISYCFDLRGPSASVDTACSSTMVAMHMACEAIWNGTSTMALAGGVNALLLPDFFVAFSQLSMLSPDGRCKAFDSRANGFVRAEGAGIVLIKPVSQAQADGDRIYAVIRGTAMNQDGRTPGMTVPSQHAQEELLRLACHNAGVDPQSINYVEAHGTGTLVGDPIEARALGNVLAAGRPADEPCIVGSVKTNVGHLEAGSGAASIIKTALALYHKKIPGNLHFNAPNPEIDFDKLGLRVPTSCQAWANGRGPRRAGINSFGYGGSNAHVILEEAPEPAPMPNGRSGRLDGRLELIPLSARSLEAVADLARSMQSFLANSPADVTIQDIASNVAFRRTHHDYRVAFAARSKDELTEQLASVTASRVADSDFRLAFICAGQGPQWWAMGRQLLAEEPMFRTIIERCDAVVRELGDWSLIDELSADEANSRMNKTAISQPAIFALQVGLAAIWQSWGVRPEALIGHSVGEVAAAHLAGVFSLEDATRIIYHRGRTMDLAPAHGRMLAASLTQEEAERLVAPYGDDVTVAAANGPRLVTLSGEPKLLEAIAEKLAAEQVFHRHLRVEYAFHSKQMDPVRDELLAALKGLKPQPAQVPLYSTVTGGRVTGTELDANYWWQNVRQMVRFVDGVNHMIDDGVDLAVELSPHPVLASGVAECYQQRGKKITVLPSLRRSEDERATMLGSLGRLHTLGYPLDWSGIVPKPRRFVSLPKYPWQHERYWFETDLCRLNRHNRAVHPLLGSRQNGPQPSWHNRIEQRLFPYLSDHNVQRATVLPAAAYLEMALAAACDVFHSETCQVENLKLHNPCLFTGDQAHWFETRYHPGDGTLQNFSRPLHAATDQATSDEWTPHGTATLRSGDPGSAGELDLESIQRRCPKHFTHDECYEYFDKLGLQYGTAFSGIVEAWQGDRESFGVVELADDLDADEYVIHPGLLDSCFQVVIPSMGDFNTVVSDLYLPVEVEHVQLYRKPDRRVWCHARMTEMSRNWRVAEIEIYNQDGQLALRARGLRTQRVTGSSAEKTLDDLLYAYQWQRVDAASRGQRSEVGGQGNDTATLTSDLRPPTSPLGWLIFADRGGVGDKLAERLRKRGDYVTLAFAGDSYGTLNTNGHAGANAYTINPVDRNDMLKLIGTATADGQPPCRGVVHLWNLDAAAPQKLNTLALDTAQEVGTLSALYLVQAWDEVAPGSTSARLALVTRGAQCVPDGRSVGESESQSAEDSGSRPSTLDPSTQSSISVAQSPLIGFGRVVGNEYPRFQSKLIDLDPCAANFDVGQLLAELDAADNEDEVALRADGRHVHRYVPYRSHAPDTIPCDADTPYRLTVAQAGTLDGLRLERVRRAAPPAGHVEIQVVASALNFSDLMKALGLYPGLPDGPVAMGAECSGIVTRVGEGVTNVEPGDEVLAVAPFAFASHVVTKAPLVAKKPQRLTFEEAATIPIAFLTAEYSLNHLGRMEAGERVLVHSASGGLGQAAVQLARLAGVEIFATAGTPEKRAFLAGQGIAHVMDSRSLAFADQVVEATDGAGVDLILNSLAGDAIPRGIAALADYGRFLEVGKRDIYGNMPLGLRPFRNNLSFFGIDLDQVMRNRPEKLNRLLNKLVDQFDAGQLQPLPHATYAIADYVEAFRFMQKGKHIGKIVISMREPPARVARGEEEPVTLRSDATYLVAGGLGGFGKAVARWMADHGARHLALMGRSGAKSAEAKQLVKELEADGVNVAVIQGDISREQDVAAAFRQIAGTMPPLRGVLHSAMVLEDGLLLNLDRDWMRRVMAPKINGAWNLHRETRELPLDFFVLFSSLSSVFGHAGQGNYAAANSFLDMLAHHRRAQGLTATTINWGYLADVGYLAEREELGEQLERKGVLSFSIHEALDALERSLQLGATQISVMRVEWSRWRGLGVTGKVSPRFAHLLPESATSGQLDGMPSVEALRAAAPAQRNVTVERLLRTKLSSVLGVEPDKLDPATPLLDLGLDSLMAVELRNWMEAELELNIPIFELMRSPSLSRVVELLCAELDNDGGPSKATKGDDDTLGARPEDLLENIDDLSGERVDDLLAKLLAEKEVAS